MHRTNSNDTDTAELHKKSNIDASTGLPKKASAEIELPDAILDNWAKFKELIT
jgi:hypothetical protein